MDERISPLAAALRVVLNDRNVAQIDVDRKIGRDNLLTDLLNGRKAWRIETIYDILDALDVGYEEFWSAVYPQGLEKAVKARTRELREENLGLREEALEYREMVDEMRRLLDKIQGS